MSLSMVQKAVLYTKQIQDVGLFATMTNSRWFVAFGGSPLYYVMLPLIGILITIMAVINGYNLAKSDNQNFDKWFGFIVSVIAAVCASVALYGAVIATYLGVSFVAGPWVFFASLALASGQQMIMLGLNLLRAFDSPKNSVQRMHHIQAAINNLYILGLVLAALGAVVFVMLFPIAPTLGSVFAITVVALTGLDILWQIIPHNWRLMIKENLLLGKPELVIPESPKEQATVDHSSSITTHNASVHHNHLFRKCDYSAQIQVLPFKEGERFLLDIIDKKIKLLSNPLAIHSEKNKQKAEYLNCILLSLNNHQIIAKKELVDQYPLALQSFWAEKGEVEQILDAAILLHDKYSENNKEVERTPIHFLIQNGR